MNRKRPLDEHILTGTAWLTHRRPDLAAHGNGNGHGKSLSTPGAADAMGGRATRSGDRSGEMLLPGAAAQMNGQRWGIYAAAIARWEALTRPAPAPTQPSKKGTPQLSPRFSEWMLGLPDGWVTDVPGLTRNDMLRILGNGVVSQQCAAALRIMTSWESVA